MVARKPQHTGQNECESRSDRSRTDTGAVKRELTRIHSGSMRVPSPAENATSRSPTTNGCVPISNTPGVQASRSTIDHVHHSQVCVPISDTPDVQASRSTFDHVLHPSVRVPISDTRGVQASRNTIGHASLPQEPHK
jgi:hypothetical protein